MIVSFLVRSCKDLKEVIAPVDAWAAFGKHCLFCAMTRNQIKGFSDSDDKSERGGSESSELGLPEKVRGS
jgi:hypothetical protein